MKKSSRTLISFDLKEDRSLRHEDRERERELMLISMTFALLKISFDIFNDRNDDEDGHDEMCRVISKDLSFPSPHLPHSINREILLSEILNVIRMNRDFAYSVYLRF